MESLEEPSKDATMEGVKIGLEIHVQLNTKAKLFCNCPNPAADAEPNTVICEVCTAQPGTKPLPPNEEAFRLALLAAHMLSCKLQPSTFFMRKHYFYPDLPSGYQRTSKPIGKDGKLADVGIWEIHVEEDPGRYELKKGLLDYNRSGVPLIEVVTAPEFKSLEQVKHFLLLFEKGLTYYGIKKEDGVIKADVNVSVAGGQRVEVKNVNSYENILAAIAYEIKRQKRLIEEGKTVEMETRHFDEAKGTTKRLRTKESEADYRYMPDPDLLEVPLEELAKATLKDELIERPWERAERFIEEYGIPKEAAEELTWEKASADLFEYMISDRDGSKKIEPRKAANWMRTTLKKQLNYRSISFSHIPISFKDVKEIATMFFSNEISDDGAETLLIKMLDERLKDARALAKKLNLFLMKEDELSNTVDKVIDEQRKAVGDYRQGEKRALAFLIGQIMQMTKGRADPKRAKELLEKRISGED